jgi:hypothetical protein
MLSSPISGINGVYVARMDYQDVAERKLTKSTEMFWTPSPSQPNQGGLLGFLPFWYYAPGGFQFGNDDNTQPIMDDPLLEDNNVAEVVARFENLIAQQIGFTAGEDVAIMGASDFSGENAHVWYNNFDKLIHYVNLNGNINVFYSTPSIYTSAKLATTPLPQRLEDVMPYFDDAHAVWSGYFSSRPALKGYIRDSSRVFQAAKQLQAFSYPPADISPSNPLFLLERAMAVTQHHDAVSGTSKQHVANDYAKSLAVGRQSADVLVSNAVAKLTGYSGAPFVGCDLSNVTICPALEGGTPTVVVVYNQLSQSRTVHVKIPIGLPTGVKSFTVQNSSAGAVASQLLPLTATDSTLRSNYYGYKSNTPVQWLFFNAVDVPPMGYTTFFITPSATTEGDNVAHFTAPMKKSVVKSADTVLSNGLISLTFSATTGLITTWSDGTFSEPFSQNFGWWNSSTGNYHNDGTGDWQQSSGAYIFRSNNTNNEPYPVSDSPCTTAFITSGPVVWEARQVFAPWLVQTVRLFAGSTTVRFEYTVGPIPFADGLGKEIITRYTTSLQNNNTWFSDSNCRDFQQRIKDYRSSFIFINNEPVAGNYVPVNCAQALFDSTTDKSLIVNVDRTQAGAGLAPGSLDFMVHRRIQQDDNRGVGEPLNETGLDGNGLIIRGTHSVDFSNVNINAQGRASLGHMLFAEHLQFAQNTVSPSSWINTNKATFSGLRAPLPPNLHVVTLHAQAPTTFLLRLAHMFGVDEDDTLSGPASCDLATLFSAFTILSAEELVLPGTIPLTAAPVTTYQVRGGTNYTLPVIPQAPAGPGLTITLSAMQIRTFKIQVSFV